MWWLGRERWKGLWKSKNGGERGPKRLEKKEGYKSTTRDCQTLENEPTGQKTGGEGDNVRQKAGRREKSQNACGRGNWKRGYVNGAGSAWCRPTTFLTIRERILQTKAQVAGRKKERTKSC